MEKFDDWKKRNMDNIDLPEVVSDDNHELFIVQLEWLNDVGFKEVDIYVNYTSGV